MVDVIALSPQREFSQIARTVVIPCICERSLASIPKAETGT